VATNTLDRIGVLGDPTRRAIFELVAEHEQPVGEIAAQLPVTRSAVSQHLRVLKDAGLVMDRAEGTRRIYRVDPDGLAALRAYFARFWGTKLAAVEGINQGAQMSTTDTSATEVRTSIVVNAPAEQAFEVSRPASDRGGTRTTTSFERRSLR
jgi:DNA-binding transcriptional ArsR family regulator